MAIWFGRRDPLAAAIRALRDERAGGGPAELEGPLRELAELLRGRDVPSEARPADRQELLGAIPDAAAIFGPEGKVRAANAALDALSGDGNALGRTALEVTRSAELAEAVAAAARGQPLRLEITLPAAQRVVLAYLSPLSRGESLLVLRDLTEAKRLEASRRDFVANASHELRTPVAAISGAAETLLGGALPVSSEARPFVEMIARHAARLSRLTQDLLDLSRLESGERMQELAPTAVAPVARAVLELIRDRARDKQLSLACEVPESARALADRRSLEQVLMNLLDNAVKYTPPGGKITVRAEPEQSGIRITVADTGPGIEPRHLGRIFERFYRADPGRSRDAGGTGLGLAIAKHLVQAQDGSVGVESGQGGSTFWIRLPAA